LANHTVKVRSPLLTSRHAITSSPRSEALTAGMLCFVLFVVGTSAVPLIGQDEARFAQAAREMLEHGELVVPTFGGEPRYDKPIFIYWCTMACYRVFGVSVRSARLPSNLAAAAAVALLALAARRCWGAGSGLLAGALLAAAPVFFIEARASTADQVMLLPTLVAMLALEWLLADEAKPRDAAVFWVAIGLSVLAKGPVGPLVAGATLLATCALERRWRIWQVMVVGCLIGAGVLGLGPVVMVPLVLLSLPAMARASRFDSRLRWSWGLPLATAVVLPWAIAAWAATGGEYFRVALGRHVVARGLTPLEGHGGFPGFYLVTACLAAFPWFPLLVAALCDRGRRLVYGTQTRFLLAWLLGPWLVLEVVQTRLVHYLLPVYPAGVLLVVGWLYSSRRGPGRIHPACLGLLLPALIGLGALPIVVVRALGIDELYRPALAVAVVMLVAVIAALASRRAPRRAAALLAAGSLSSLLVLVAVFLPQLAPYFIAGRTATAVTATRRPGEAVVLYRAGHDELLFALPSGTRRCQRPEQMTELLTGKQPLLGVTAESHLGELGDLVHPVHSVDGIDPGHGRWCRMVLFRPTATSHEPAVKQ